jgi:YaiO family outer membrane protein
MYRITNSLLLCFLVLSFFQAQGQNNPPHDTINVDVAFDTARKMAFSGRRTEAVTLAKRILRKSPNYSDVRTFLGRIYTWNHQYDSARAKFHQVLDTKPADEDTRCALVDLEYWSGNSRQAVKEANTGLIYHPDSRDLLFKKAKAVADTGNYKAAYTITDTLLAHYPKDAQAIDYQMSLRRKLAINDIGLVYYLDVFNIEYANPQSLVSLSYSQHTSIGTVVGRITYANRFGNANGSQYEIDAYPNISKRFYAYVNAGYSSYTSLFPNYKFGASLYSSLPKSFEADIGFRYLYFSSPPTLIYTAAIGKYYKNFWFSLRTYLVPGSYSSISESYLLTTRYYLGSADNYFSLIIGTGISPDDRSMEDLVSNPSLRSNEAKLSFQKIFASRWIISVGTGLVRSDFTRGSGDLTGNDYSFFAGLDMLF